MSDEQTKDQVSEEVESQQADQTPNETQQDAEEFDKERAMELINKLRGIEKDHGKLQKELAKYQQAEEERKKAEMTEIDRAKAEAAELQAKVKQYEISETRRQVIAQVGIDAKLADFLKGETEEEIKASAEALKAALPQQKQEEAEKQQTARLNPSNPAGGAAAKETPAEQRRILGIGY